MSLILSGLLVAATVILIAFLVGGFLDDYSEEPERERRQ